MRFDILTIFPEFFEGPLRAGILGRALEAGQVAVQTHNLRDWTTNRHRSIDDTPYGGGGGMVMRPEPLLAAIRAVRAQTQAEVGDSAESEKARVPVIHLSPQGETLTQALVCELAALPRLILLCSAYEGVDERVIELEVDREISIGDYVLTSGELPALVLVNAIARRIEGVLGNPESAPNDSFEHGLLDCPHYTRPELVEGRPVPPVLLSGHHAKVQRWRRDRALERTFRRRPDLLAAAPLDKHDLRLLRTLRETAAPADDTSSPAGE